MACGKVRSVEGVATVRQDCASGAMLKVQLLRCIVRDARSSRALGWARRIADSCSCSPPYRRCKDCSLQARHYCRAGMRSPGLPFLDSSHRRARRGPKPASPPGNCAALPRSAHNWAARAASPKRSGVAAFAYRKPIRGHSPKQPHRLSYLSFSHPIAARHKRTHRNRSALPMTDTELKLMAPAATMGLRSRPKAGYRTPAAIGIPSTL